MGPHSISKRLFPIHGGLGGIADVVLLGVSALHLR